MEAANKGASRVPGARNMGMGITLPFEEGEKDLWRPCVCFVMCPLLVLLPVLIDGWLFTCSPSEVVVGYFSPHWT